MLNGMKIVIEGNEFEVKCTLKMLIYFEDVTENRPYRGGYKDNCLLFWLCVKVNNEKFSMDYEPFLDFLDKNVWLLSDFLEMFAEWGTRKDKSKKKAVKD